MSDLRKQVKDTKRKVEELRAAMDELAAQTSPLQQSIWEGQSVIVKEEGLLTKRKWKPVLKESCEGSSFYLECIGDWEDFPELRDLYRPDYHDHTPLVCRSEVDWYCPLVELNWSDGDMTLTFEDDEIALRFVKDYGIRIDLSLLEAEREKMRKMLDAFDTVVAHVKESLRAS